MRAMFPLLLILGCGTLPEEEHPATPPAVTAGELRVELDPEDGGALEQLEGGGFVYREGHRRLSLHLIPFEPEPEPTLDWHDPPRPDPRRATADWTGPHGATGIAVCEPADARAWCEDVLARVRVARDPLAHS